MPTKKQAAIWPPVFVWRGGGVIMVHYAHDGKQQMRGFFVETFSVMSFNIRGAFPEKQPARRWQNRADINTRTITARQPDLIGFQEVQIENADHYNRHLAGYHHVVGCTSPHEQKWVMNPIYYAGKRWALIDSGGFFLSQTPDVWSKGWDSAFVRGATWGRLQSKQTGAEIVHLNAHLDHIGERARVESARLIVAMLDEVSDGLPVIVTADFNSRAWAPDNEHELHYPPAVHRDKLPPGGTVHGIFTASGFRDTYIESGNTDHLNCNTFHGFSGEAFPPCALRIDWVLIRDGVTRNIETDGFDIVRDAEPPIYPSDHYPVLARLRLGD